MKCKLTALILFLSLLLITCKHEIPFSKDISNGNDPVVNSGACSPDSVYFANVILPLISSNCAISGCHDPVTHEDGLVLNSYAGIMAITRSGNARESKLYRVITTSDQGDVMPPPPHSPLSSSNKDAVLKWINQGAKNNLCTDACDTTAFTFSATVVPLINNYCKGCHNPASLGGGIDLSSYSGIKSVAVNGKLMGSITHSPGYVAMPQGGNKLQDCQVKQIEKWIKAGLNNN